LRAIDAANAVYLNKVYYYHRLYGIISGGEGLVIGRNSSKTATKRPWFRKAFR